MIDLMNKLKWLPLVLLSVCAPQLHAEIKFTTEAHLALVPHANVDQVRALCGQIAEGRSSSRSGFYLRDIEGSTYLFNYTEQEDSRSGEPSDLLKELESLLEQLPSAKAGAFEPMERVFYGAGAADIEPTGEVVRIAMMTGLKPEQEAHYRSLHSNPWPDVLAAIGRANLRHFSIFIEEIEGKLYLFGWLEYIGHDSESDEAINKKDPASIRWWKETDACQIAPADAGDGMWGGMEELAFFDRTPAQRPTPKPNFIVIFVDDLGYGDLGCYGSAKHRTPQIDRMAEQGMRFTDFYSSSGVCTPSRASLMTGSYAQRVSLELDSNNKWVLFPNAKKGLHPDEITIAEMLKDDDYASACIGKWHLGDQAPFLPTSQGFDYYYGIPYSNDMDREGIPLPLMRNETVIEAPVNQVPLTQNYTAEALQFIEKNQDRPFFLYLPHTMPHIPLYSSEPFRGRSANGDYGDAVEELDWSTGRILAKLKELGIDDNTLVIFTSDNGADARYGGSNAPLKGWKGDTDEGSMRIPFIARWPGRIPADTVCTEVAATIDILPTFAALSGANMPDGRIIDGKNIWPLLSGEPGAQSPHEAYYYYHTDQLQAVRSGDWKLVLPQNYKKIGWNQHLDKTPASLYNLRKDIQESNDLSADNPEIVIQLTDYADRAKRDIGDLNQSGGGEREAGWIENPTPQLLKNR